MSHIGSSLKKTHPARQRRRQRLVVHFNFNRLKPCLTPHPTVESPSDGSQPLPQQPHTDPEDAPAALMIWGEEPTRPCSTRGGTTWGGRLRSSVQRPNYYSAEVNQLDTRMHPHQGGEWCNENTLPTVRTY